MPGRPGGGSGCPNTHNSTRYGIAWQCRMPYRGDHTNHRGGNHMKQSSRQARQTIRTRTRSQRAAARIARRGNASLTTHCLAAGLTPKEARAVAGSLRKAAGKLGITGTTARTHTAGRMRDCRRYSPSEVAQAAVVYRPRKAAYKDAAARLALAA